MLTRFMLALLVLGAAFAPPAGAQPPGLPVESAADGTVEGLVTTADGRAVVGARVGLVGMAEPTATSDVDGRFRLANLPAGQYKLRVELEGFGRRERPVEVQAGATTRLRMTLPFLPFSETVTVTATRSERKVGDSPADLTVLTREDLQRWPAPAMDDALKQVPSFSLFRRTSSLVSHPTTQGVSLRGVGASGASRTLVLVDGVPHNDAFGNWVYWDSIPQLQVESIEVAPSGLSHLYGSSAMAGVINVATRRPEARTASARAFGGSRGTVNTELFGSHASGPLAGSVGGSFFRTDGYELVREDQRGPVDVEASSRHRTGNWRVEYAPSPGFMLFQNGRLFAEDRENGTPLQTNSTRETYLGGGLRANNASSGIWQANVYSHLDDFDSTFSAVSADRASETLSLVQAVDYKDVGGNLQWSRRLGASNELGIGGDVRWIEADNNEDVYIAPAVNVRDRLIPAQQIYAGAYIQDVVTPGRRAVVTLGLRVDHWRNYDASQTEIVNSTGATTVTPYADTSKTRVTPRGGVLVHLSDAFALRAAAYGGFRAPSLNELYRPFRVGNVLTQGNPNLGPERLLGAELGLNHTLGSKLSWRATGFWDRVDDPIANVTVSVTSALITRQRQNLGQTRIRGVSFDADYHPAPELRLQGSYVLSDARVTEFSAAPEIQGNLLPQVPRHRASLRVDYLDPDLLNVSLRYRFESSRFDDDQNRLQLDHLFQMDLTLDRPFGDSWGAFVSIENLFDHRYPVQATPVELLGTPFTVTAGLRFDLRRH
jgi:outer membrane receptor protein involved in Fe transport